MLRQIGPMEIALIVIVALLIFGPSKLPQLGKSVGETFREFKKSMKAIKEDVALDAETEKKSETKPEPKTDA